MNLDVDRFIKEMESVMNHHTSMETATDAENEDESSSDLDFGKWISTIHKHYSVLAKLLSFNYKSKGYNLEEPQCLFCLMHIYLYLFISLVALPFNTGYIYCFCILLLLSVFAGYLALNSLDFAHRLR